jgi:hypothetical protein
MKRTIALFYIFFAVSLHGQTWIDQGAVWHYDWSGTLPGFDKIEYVGDTLIQNKNCQKLEITSYMFAPLDYSGELLSTSYKYQFTYQSNDTVFYLVNDQFHILYDFGAKIGDKWSLGIDTNEFDCGPSWVEVESAGSTVIGGDTLEWISVVTLPNSSVGLSGKIYKRFGAQEDYLFPTPRNCDSAVIEWYVYRFSCFADDSFPVYNVTGKECDYLLRTSVQKLNTKDKIVSIFPNPTTNKLSVKLLRTDRRILNLQILDVQGRIMKNFTEKEIDVSGLSKGIYIIRLELDNNEWIVEKFVRD